ncbi:Hypothetical protein HVR_LOCUS1227 [uncultured virus]|nr:Hypothetical protein HVR_LOCUS1227 [uncultured virus]
MLILKIDRFPAPIIKPLSGDIPTEFNELPVVRTPKELGRKGLTNKTIIDHPSGIKLSRVPNGYIILCSHPDCGNIGSKDDMKCVKHVETYRYCRQAGCQKRANFGYEARKSLYCAGHRQEDMIDVIHKKCAKCETLPYFGYPGGSADYCSQHKLEGMIDVIHKRCIAPGCNKSPSFGKEGGPPQYCSEHRPVDVIDVKHKRCIAPGCPVSASFGVPGEPAQHCAQHKLDGMMNFRTKKCAVIECMVVPSFGMPGGSTEYCNQHKLDGMINVKDKKCSFPGCILHPCFGFIGGNMDYCNRHKRAGMINIRNRKCSFEDCMVQARFALPEEEAQYCSEHRLTGMVNVKDKYCDFSDCELRPSYSFLFSTVKSHCKKHASLNEYMYEKRNPICIELKCMNRALFVSPDDITVSPIRCVEHKLPDDIELINRVCPNCEQSIYYPSNQEFCMNCGKYRELFIISARETAVERLLQSNNISFVHDKRVSLHGSRHRPDFRMSSNFGYIILEVDENQHNKYLEFEEKNRMKAIYYDVQLIDKGKQVLFIRYNPDKYDGAPIDDKKRLEYLLLVTNSMKQLPSIGVPLGYVKMFYDGFTGAPSIEPLDIEIGYDYDD